MIRTVLGDIEASAFGVCYPHEHLLTAPPASAGDPDFTMESEDAATEELGSFHRAGGRSIVEMSPRDYGRNPTGLARVSERSGVHVVCTTGWHKAKFSEPWVAARTVDDIAEEMVREVQEGIDGTSVRAGLIKGASSLDEITASEEKVLRAAARAQRATGVPISTHTEAGTMGLEQVAVLTSEGVDPSRIVIGHIDRRMDLDYQRALLQTGVAIIYDQLSKEKYYPDALRVDFIKTLAAEGWGGQLLLSGDLARRSYWPSYGDWGGPGLTYILWRFVPWLREAGVDAATIDQILVRNPARVFTMTT